MSIRDKFVYVTTKEQDQTLIGIKEGKFAGVVYKYGKVGFGDGVPSIPNTNASGATGDVLITNGTSVGTIWLKMKKVSGWDNIT